LVKRSYAGLVHSIDANWIYENCILFTVKVHWYTLEQCDIKGVRNQPVY
jgi:hypothetical protein